MLRTDNQLVDCSRCVFDKEPDYIQDTDCSTRHACMDGYWKKAPVKPVKPVGPANLPEEHLALPVIVKHGSVAWMTPDGVTHWNVVPGTISIVHNNASYTLYGFCVDAADAWGQYPLGLSFISKWALFRQLEDTP